MATLDSFLNKISTLAKQLGIWGRLGEHIPSSDKNLSLEEILALKIILGDEQKVKECLSLAPDLDFRTRKGFSFLDLADLYHHEKIKHILESDIEFNPEKERKRTKSGKKK